MILCQNLTLSVGDILFMHAEEFANMHCHLMSCIKEFGPAHSFFERYNGILEAQPTNNRSIELQLMNRFQKDNLHLHLHHEAKQWPNADYFLEALPDPPFDSSSTADFDDSVIPGHKSIIAILTILQKYYAKLYPNYANTFHDGLTTSFRKY